MEIKDYAFYLSFLKDIENFTYEFCSFNCSPQPPSNIIWGDKVFYEIIWSDECSDKREICVFIKWGEYDEYGNYTYLSVGFPYRYLYEDDWRQQEYTLQEKRDEERIARNKANEELKTKQELEDYYRLKQKYEGTNILPNT